MGGRGHTYRRDIAEKGGDALDTHLFAHASSCPWLSSFIGEVSSSDRLECEQHCLLRICVEISPIVPESRSMR